MADDLRIARFSDAEFEKLIGSNSLGDVRVELRGGALHRMSPQHLPHARIKSDLADELKRAIGQASMNLEVVIEVSVGFGGGFTPLPDIVVWRPSDAATTLPGADVALIVEVADTTLGDDLGAKLLSYARAGVAEYWVADVAGRVIHQCFEPSAEGYATRRVIPFGQTIEAKTLPNVVLHEVLARWAN